MSKKKFKNIKPGTKNQDFFSYIFFEFKATEANTCERIRLNYGLMTFLETLNYLILIFTKSKSLIQLVAESVVKRIEYKYGHSGSKCINEIVYHLN